MLQTLNLPSLTVIPEDIEAQLRQLWQQPAEPALEEWLFELIKNSGHLSTTDHLQWRLVSLIWLAAEFNADKAWPYLMWLNMNEPVISDHLAEILAGAANDLDCHVQLANWLAKITDQRLLTFLGDFHPMPARYHMPALVRRLLTQPAAPETGVWLAAYCQHMAADPTPSLRPWRLLAAAWYATYFDPTAGLAYLRELSQGQPTLSPVDNQLLTDTANEVNGTAALIQGLAACPDPAVKTMLKDFGHPDLTSFVSTLFQQPPDYNHLANSLQSAPADARRFKQAMKLLEAAGVSPTAGTILDLACGPLASQTLLFNSVGYQIIGADLQIPPAYLPIAGPKQWLKRGQYVKAWKAVTAPYYQTLAQQTGLKLNWSRVKIELADVTRLQFPNEHFTTVICLNHLQHAPHVEGLLAEAARVLKPNGLLLASIQPYPGLTGAFQPVEPASAWNHLRRPGQRLPASATPLLNQCRETQYRTAFEKYFTIEQWLTEQNEQALAYLTQELRTELANYDEAELTRQQIIIVARKKV